jgi:hypothetical protein
LLLDASQSGRRHGPDVIDVGEGQPGHHQAAERREGVVGVVAVEVMHPDAGSGALCPYQ